MEVAGAYLSRSGGRPCFIMSPENPGDSLDAPNLGRARGRDAGWSGGGGGRRRLTRCLSRCSRGRATLQGVVDRGEDLIDSDVGVAVGIAGFAFGDGCVPQSDVHHGQDLVHRHHSVTVAVTNAGTESRGWRRRRSYQPQSAPGRRRAGGGRLRGGNGCRRCRRRGRARHRRCWRPHRWP